MKRRALLCLLLGLVALPAFAEEEKKKEADEPKVKVATTKEYEKERTIFDRDFDTVDIDFKLQALNRFGKCVHKDVTKELLELLYRSKDVHVRAEAARGLMHQVPFGKTIGPKAVKVLEDDQEDAKVLAPLVASVGKLKYYKAWEAVAELISHDDDKVVIACFQVFGEWKDLRPHREIQNFWDMYPEEGSFATGTVTVDTGAAGDTDQRAAKAKWKAKYGNKAKQRPRPECVKAMKAAIKKMTGEDIEKPAEWRKWCKDNKAKIKAAERRK